MRRGDFNAKFKTAKDKLEAIYETPFLAHAPIEPEVRRYTCATMAM